MNKGFSLVETLVAITILMIAVVAPMSLSQRSLQAARFSKDQTIASYLAQDGMEYVVYVRDSNTRSGNDWLLGLSSCISGSCIVDSANDSIESCGASCPVLRFDDETGFYGHDSDWGQTNFTRSVDITSLTGIEVKVEVTVSWSSGPFSERSVSVTQNLFDWQ